MKLILTLTRKVFLGYLIMICLVILEGAYAIFELNRLNRLTYSMVHGEVVTLGLEKDLIDLFLSEVSSEKKYLVVQDRDFLDLALSKGRAFDENLLKLKASRLKNPDPDSLEHLQKLHDRHRKGFLLAVARGEKDPAAARKELSVWGLKSETGIRDLTRGIELLVRKEEAEIARRMHEAQMFSLRAYQMTIGIVVSMAIFGMIVAWLLTQRIRGPVQKLKEGTRYISQGIFDQRIQVHSRDELGDLARAFNVMTGKLAELERMKQELISNISHELRTPLTSISGAAGLLQDEIPGPVNKKQKHLLGIIEEEIGKLLRLINNLLDLSKIRAGMMQYHFEKTGMVPILKNGMAHIRFLAELKGIQLNLDVADGLPVLRMDSEKIEQVVNNLLANAVKFTRQGGWIRIRAVREPGVVRDSSRDGERVLVCIEDNGIGMDPDQLSGIFDRYRQADPVLGMKTPKGTGLGLSICKYYIEEHGGRIWVESQKGVGSRFCFDLPVAHEPKEVLL